MKIQHFLDVGKLAKDVSFSDLRISEAMSEQASLFIHYGILAAKASKQVSDAKMVLENTEARVYRDLKDEFTKASIKVTEAALEKAMLLNKEVQQAKMAVSEAEQIEQICKIATEGFRHRKDMLIQSASTSREEMRGEISTLKKSTFSETLNREGKEKRERFLRDKD